MQAVQLPAWFPIQESNTVIDYAPVFLGEGAYTLPTKAIVFARVQTGLQTRNEMTFLHYRKFEAQSVLTFGEAAVPDKAGVKK